MGFDLHIVVEVRKEGTWVKKGEIHPERNSNFQHIMRDFVGFDYDEKIYYIRDKFSKETKESEYGSIVCRKWCSYEDFLNFEWYSRCSFDYVTSTHDCCEEVTESYSVYVDKEEIKVIEEVKKIASDYQDSDIRLYFWIET